MIFLSGYSGAAAAQGTLILAKAAPFPALEGRSTTGNFETRIFTAGDCPYGAKRERTTEGDDIVVCARTRTRYRLDPALRLAEQSAQAQPGRGNPAVEPLKNACDPTSARGCPYSNAIPITAILVTVVESSVRALRGEDWREPWRTNGQGGYERYRRLRAQ